MKLLSENQTTIMTANTDFSEMVSEVTHEPRMSLKSYSQRIFANFITQKSSAFDLPSLLFGVNPMTKNSDNKGEN